MDEIPAGQRKSVQTNISAREGHIDGMAVPMKSPRYPGSERALRFANGMMLSAGNNGHGSMQMKMEQKDLNELAMMLDCGNEVRIIYPKR